MNLNQKSKETSKKENSYFLSEKWTKIVVQDENGEPVAIITEDDASPIKAGYTICLTPTYD